MSFIYLFIFFITYSILGWMCEIIWCSVGERKFVKERGFFLGPWCPIYGFGAIIIVKVLNVYQNDPLVLFIMTIFITTILEYFTSYILEKMFNNRWWDYSGQFLNVEGRICLINCITFGLAALFVTYSVQPVLENLIYEIPNLLIIILFIISFSFFMFDVVVSLVSAYKLKEVFSNMAKKGFNLKNKILKKDDVYEKISAFHKVYIRNFLKSFPNLTKDLKEKDKIIDLFKKKK